MPCAGWSIVACQGAGLFYTDAEGASGEESVRFDSRRKTGPVTPITVKKTLYNGALFMIVASKSTANAGEPNAYIGQLVPSKT